MRRPLMTLMAKLRARHTRCESFTTGLGTCYDAGRTEDSPYTADQVCDACLIDHYLRVEEWWAGEDVPAQDPGEVANRLRLLRLRAGFTQAEVGARLGVTQAAVSQWESGRQEPRLSTFLGLLRLCGREILPEDMGGGQVVGRVHAPDEVVVTVTYRLRSPGWGFADVRDMTDEELLREFLEEVITGLPDRAALFEDDGDDATVTVVRRGGFSYAPEVEDE